MYMFHTDNDYYKAKKQLQYCEENSDVTSDLDKLQNLSSIQKSRIRKPPNRFDDTDNSDSEDNGQKENQSKSNKKSHGSHSLPRPSLISFSSGNLCTYLYLLCTYYLFLYLENNILHTLLNIIFIFNRR